MLVVGAPLAALAENEWGTGIRVHRRHFRAPRHETQRGREPARQAWSLRHRARALLVMRGASGRTCVVLGVKGAPRPEGAVARRVGPERIAPLQKVVHLLLEHSRSACAVVFLRQPMQSRAFNSEGSGRLICWMKASLSRKTTVAN